MNDDYQLAELDRRLACLLMAGCIDAVDHSRARARVAVGDWKSAWLPWTSLSAGEVRKWRAPTLGEQVMLVSPSGLPEGGFILPGFYTDQHAAPDSRPHVTADHMPDGTLVQYDWETHQYLVDVPAGGELVLRVGQTRLVLRDDGTTLTTPKLTVDSPQSTFTGMVIVQKLFSFLSGMVGKGGASSDVTVAIEGNIAIKDGDIAADDITLKGHCHQEQGNYQKTSTALK